MRNLLQAAFRSKKHLKWFSLTFVTLWALTIADQLEMVSLGVIASNGNDFFALFGNGGEVKRETLDLKWDEIDQSGKGVINKSDASTYLSSQKKGNPVNRILHTIQSKLHLNGGQNFQLLIWTLLSIAIFKGITLFSSRYTTKVLAIRISRDLRQRYFEHIQTLPMSFYQKFNIGSLASRVVNDANQISLSINAWIMNYLHTPFVVFASLFACFYLSWKLSLVIFVGAPLIILPVVLITRKVKKIMRQLQRGQESFTSVLIDYLAGIQTVKIFSMESFSLIKYKEENDRVGRLEVKGAKYDLLTRPALHFVTTVCLAFIMVFGLYFLGMYLADLLVFCGILHLFYEPIRKFADQNAEVQRGVVAAERLFEVLSIKPDIEDAKDAIELESFNDEIIFEDVWFKYEKEWVLRGVNFTIKKGETVAIVGSTGAGKSTILQLIARLYEVQKGKILIDGIPIGQYKQKSLRNNLSYVSQKPFLFYDTIRANICYGNDFTHDVVETAAKRAHAHEFISALPDQYDTMLSETGKNFSGGEQQRIAIARALAKGAPILILDEATSSLDTVSEHKIKQAIYELQGSMTQIIVAHRLSTIEHADRILFLDGGKVLAEGDHKTLLGTCQPFRKMWEYHSGTKGEELVSQGSL